MIYAFYISFFKTNIFALRGLFLDFFKVSHCVWNTHLLFIFTVIFLEPHVRYMIEITTAFLVVQTNPRYYTDRFYICPFPPFQNAFLDSLMI